ncbi:MAG: protein kinase [Bradymonadaceae bacterium]
MTDSDPADVDYAQLPDVGEVLDDRYELKSVIDAGGMGVILRARQRAMDRDVAVKLLHPHLADDEQTAARFEREVDTAKELTHPHAIQFFDFGQTNSGVLYIVMELLEGRDLDQLLDERAPLSLGRTVEITEQALDALAEAHARGIAHRDLKPSNIFLVDRARGGDFVKLLDFGVAKSLQATKTAITTTGKVCGTPTYMSPEAIVSQSAGKAGDVYAMGLIFVEMLTARQVFDAENVGTTLLMHMRSPIAIPDPLEGTALAEFVRRSTAKKPQDRYADGSEMLEALATVTDDLAPDSILEPEAHPTPVPPDELASSEGLTPPSPTGIDTRESAPDDSTELVPGADPTGSGAEPPTLQHDTPRELEDVDARSEAVELDADHPAVQLLEEDPADGAAEPPPLTELAEETAWDAWVEQQPADESSGAPTDRHPETEHAHSGASSPPTPSPRDDRGTGDTTESEDPETRSPPDQPEDASRKAPKSEAGPEHERVADAPPTLQSVDLESADRSSHSQGWIRWVVAAAVLAGGIWGVVAWVDLGAPSSESRRSAATSSEPSTPEGSEAAERAGSTTARTLGTRATAVAGRVNSNADQRGSAESPAPETETARDEAGEPPPKTTPARDERTGSGAGSETTGRLFSDPSGASVRVDDRKVGETPLDLDELEADDPIQVELRLPGHRPKTLRVDPTSAKAYEAKLTPSPSAGDGDREPPSSDDALRRKAGEILEEHRIEDP